MKSKTRLLLVVLLLALTFTFALAACEGKEATPVSVEVVKIPARTVLGGAELVEVTGGIGRVRSTTGKARLLTATATPRKRP